MRGLRTFCIAARRLSFKQAADDLCVTPSAVSHQIKMLEASLGVTLFERLTREIALTEPGASLYAQLRPLLGEIDQVTSRFRERAVRSRPLRISLLPFFASEMLVPRLNEFTADNPSVQIRVETIDAGVSHPATSDASILLRSDVPADLRAHSLFSLSLVPACSPDVAERIDPGEAESLLAQTLIVHKSRPNAWNEWFDGRGLGASPEPRVLYLDSMFAVARAAERGLGVALVPLPLGDSWFGSGALTRAHSAELATSDRYYFVYREEDATNRDVCAFRDWVVATFGEA